MPFLQTPGARLGLLLLLASPAAHSASFELGLGYAQSGDFWKSVHEVQDQTGNIREIDRLVRERYGRPDIAYSFLDAAYAYEPGWFESLPEAWIGTRAEALAGGEVSNPIFPEIQAYANTIGFASYGLRSRPDSLARGHSFCSLRALGGAGSERRLFAKGPELIDSIPVRKGTLLAIGAEAALLDQREFGDDFWITTSALLRPLHFRSSVDSAPSFPDEEHSFTVWRWKLQNEWLKEAETPLAARTRFGILSVLGQTPTPFGSMPLSWDYQQRTQLFPGLGAVSGIGGIVRFLSRQARPNLALYFGDFGGAPGGGADLQLGALLLNASSYALENSLTIAHDRTRLWQFSAGLFL